MKTIQATNHGVLNSVLDQLYNSTPTKTGIDIADISHYITDSFMKEIQSFSERVTRLNKFIAMQSVQDEVARDYNTYNYIAFDAKPGDGLCEARVFMMEIFLRYKSYNELRGEEKLLITLSHIMSKNRIDHRNALGILASSTYMNGNIGYSGEVLPEFKVAVSAYQNISAAFIKTLCSADRITRVCSVEGVTKYMELIKEPIYYLITHLKYEDSKHTRLGSTIISSESKEIALSDLDALSTKPLFICEVVSVVSRQGDKIKKGPLRDRNIDTFERFISSVISFGPSKLLHSAAVLDDRSNREPNASRLEYIKGTGSYKFEDKLPTTRAPFHVAHFYITNADGVRTYVRN